MARSAGPGETAVARFADGVLEAGWLLALLVVPVFFDVYSSRPFEPDKAMLVRVLALVMAAAGVARAFGTQGRPRLSLAAPLVLPVALYVGAAAVSTAFSLDPRSSLWGSDVRGEGLATLAGYVVVFAAVAARLRRRAQLDRAVDVIVAGSLPVALYGLLQAAGLDVLAWKRTYEEWRVSTTLGNPVFAGSYLILTLPVTLAALLEQRARAVTTSGEAWWRRLRVAVYASAAVLQLSVLALTGSRGPWLGAAASLVAFALLGAALGRRRRRALAALAAGVAGLAFVAVLNVPGGPLEALRDTRLLRRLAHILDARGTQNPGDLARLRVWEGALALARPRPPLPLAEGEDGKSALRPLVGYGPETLQVAFGAIYDAEFARLERRNPDLADTGVSTFYTRVPDRSHNELLDSLVAGGLLGALAHLVLAGGIQVFGLRALGLLGSPREKRQLAGLALAGGALGTIVAGVALSWGFAAVGLPLGLVAGWTVYVLGRAFAPKGTRATPRPLEVALVAALLGHFVDVHFGPVVVTGRLYFWALAGLLVTAARVRGEEERRAPPAAGEAETPADPERWPWLRPGVAAGLIAAALAITLLYDFVGVASRGASALAGVWRVVSGGAGPHRSALAGGSAAVLALATLEAARARSSPARVLLTATLVSIALGAAFAVVHVVELRSAADARKVAELVWSLGGVFTRYALSLLALQLSLGVALARAGPKSPRGAALRAALAAAAALALALALGVRPALATVGARVLARAAAELQAHDFVADGLALFDRAAATAPWEASVFRAQGEAYLTASRRTGSPLRRPEYLRRAEEAFGRARALDPFTPDNHANLARLARWRAELSQVPAVSMGEADEAARHYAAAARLVPANTLLLDEWAELDFVRRGDFASALEKLERSLRLDPSFDYTYAALGDLYMARAKTGAGDPVADYRRAAEAYSQAFARRPSLKAIISLGLAYERLGEKQQALDTYVRALAMRPPYGTSWAVHERLAFLHLAPGNRAEAQREAQIAQYEAPERDRPGLVERLRAAGLV